MKFEFCRQNTGGGGHPPGPAPRAWESTLVRRDGHRVEVAVAVPASAPVGLW